MRTRRARSVRWIGWCLAAMVAVPVHAAGAAVTDSLSWTTLLDDQAQAFGRGNPSLVFDSRRNRVLALCGANETYCKPGPGVPLFTVTTWFDDVRSIDVAADSEWQVLAVPPSPRRNGAAAVYDSIGDRVLLFGGGSGSETWVLNLASATWDSIPLVGPGPGPRAGGSLTLDPVRQRLLLFGGRVAGTPTALDDVWEMPLSTPGTWNRIQPAGSPPPARFLHLAAYDPGRDRLIVSGGSNGGDLSDTWALQLSGSPAWTLIAPSGSGPSGRVMGGIDVHRDRLIAVTAGAGMTVRAIDLANDVWSVASPSGMSPVEIDPTRVFLRSVAAVDPVHDAIVLSWSVYGDGLYSCVHGPQSGWTHVLRMGELPTVHLTAMLDSVSFAQGFLYENWTVTPDRVPWSPIQFESDLPSPNSVYAVTTQRSGGPVQNVRVIGPGAPFHSRVRWFDGQQIQETPDVTIVRPPPPVVVKVTLESSAVVWDQVSGVFHLESDSLWYVTPTTLQFRVNGGPWTVDRVAFPDLDGRFGFASGPLGRNTTIDYRLGWNADPPPGAPVFPFTIPNFGIAVFDSSHVTAQSISIHWHADPIGAPLAGFIRKSGAGGAGWVDTVEVHSNQQGRIVFMDALLAPGTFYAYELYLLNAGVPRIFTEIGLFTLGTAIGGGGPGGPALNMTSPYPNPAASEIRTTITVPPGSAATVDLFDITGRRRWSQSLDAGVHPMTVDVTGLDRGIYTLVVRRDRQLDSRRIAVIR